MIFVQENRHGIPIGVNKVRITSFVPQGRFWDNRHLFETSKGEKLEFSKITKDAKLRHNLDLQFSGSFDVDEAYKVLVARNRSGITSDGLFIPSLALRMDKGNP